LLEPPCITQFLEAPDPDALQAEASAFVMAFSVRLSDRRRNRRMSNRNAMSHRLFRTARSRRTFTVLR